MDNCNNKDSDNKLQKNKMTFEQTIFGCDESLTLIHIKSFRKILNFYIVILIIIPIVFIFPLIWEYFEIDKMPKGYHGSSWVLLFITPAIIIINILVIISIKFIKKSKNRITLAIWSLLIGLFPISLYWIFLFKMIESIIKKIFY